MLDWAVLQSYSFFNVAVGLLAASLIKFLHVHMIILNVLKILWYPSLSTVH